MIGSEARWLRRPRRWSGTPGRTARCRSSEPPRASPDRSRGARRVSHGETLARPVRRAGSCCSACAAPDGEAARTHRSQIARRRPIARTPATIASEAATARPTPATPVSSQSSPIIEALRILVLAASRLPTLMLPLRHAPHRTHQRGHDPEDPKQEQAQADRLKPDVPPPPLSLPTVTFRRRHREAGSSDQRPNRRPVIP